MSKNILPLKTAGDAQEWLEKTVNETQADATSISLANGRIGAIKTLIGLQRLKLDYAKAVKQGATLTGVGDFLGIDVNQIEKK